MLGCRVVRGPDWQWEDQDGGNPLRLGTVIKFRKKRVMVLWDNGSKGNYRCGVDDKFDLLIYDSGPAGRNEGFS